jgi:hypothetical protein
VVPQKFAIEVGHTLSPDHDPGKPVIAIEAVPVNGLDWRVVAGLPKDDAKVAGAPGAIAE